MKLTDICWVDLAPCIHHFAQFIIIIYQDCPLSHKIHNPRPGRQGPFCFFLVHASDWVKWLMTERPTMTINDRATSIFDARPDLTMLYDDTTLTQSYCKIRSDILRTWELFCFLHWKISHLVLYPPHMVACETAKLLRRSNFLCFVCVLVSLHSPVYKLLPLHRRR